MCASLGVVDALAKPSCHFNLRVHIADRRAQLYLDS